jgi:hypothetical protein
MNDILKHLTNPKVEPPQNSRNGTILGRSRNINDGGNNKGRGFNNTYEGGSRFSPNLQIKIP